MDPLNGTFEDDFTKLRKALSGDVAYAMWLRQQAELCRLGESSFSDEIFTILILVSKFNSAEQYEDIPLPKHLEESINEQIRVITDRQFKKSIKELLMLMYLVSGGKEDLVAFVEGDPVLSEVDGIYIIIDQIVEELEELTKDFTQILNNLRAYTGHKEGDKPSLYEEQLPIFRAISMYLYGGGKSGYIKAPTGIGKTVIFSKIIEGLAKGLKEKVMIVVPNQNLVKQTAEKIIKFTEFTEDQIGFYYTQEKILGRQITITTYHSLVSATNSGVFNPDDYPIMILDEAHRGTSKKRAKTIGRYKGIKIGFTATPHFSKEKTVKNILPDEIYHMSVLEAVEQLGLLSSFKVVVQYFSDVDLAEADTGTGDYEEAALGKILQRHGVSIAALNAYNNYIEEGDDRAIIYCSGIEHSENVAQVFRDAGIEAQAVHSKLSRARRDEILNDFHEGKIKVLTNPDVLVEGFDEEKIKLIINLRATLSRVVAEQRGGRGIRRDPDNPNKIAIIIEFVYYNSKRARNGKPLQILYPEVVGISEAFSNVLDEETIERIKRRINQKSERLRQRNQNSDQPQSEVIIIDDAREIIVLSKRIAAERKDYPQEFAFEVIRDDIDDWNRYSQMGMLRQYVIAYAGEEVWEEAANAAGVIIRSESTYYQVYSNFGKYVGWHTPAKIKKNQKFLNLANSNKERWVIYTNYDEDIELQSDDTPMQEPIVELEPAPQPTVEDNQDGDEAIQDQGNVGGSQQNDGLGSNQDQDGQNKNDNERDEPSSNEKGNWIQRWFRRIFGG